MTLMAPVVARKVADNVRHRHGNLRPPRNHSLLKRVLLGVGLGIGLIIGVNVYLSANGGVFGILRHDMGKPTSTTATVVVPDIARITAEVRKLGNLDGTEHRYPIAFDYKVQRTFLGINAGSSMRHFEGIGVAVASVHVASATFASGTTHFPTAEKDGTISLTITLPHPAVTTSYFADSNIGTNSGHFMSEVSDARITPVAKTMLADAIRTDPTLLTNTQQDVESTLGHLIQGILDAGHYQANLKFTYN